MGNGNFINIDDLSSFEQAKHVVQCLRQASERGEWRDGLSQEDKDEKIEKIKKRYPENQWEKAISKELSLPWYKQKYLPVEISRDGESCQLVKDGKCCQLLNNLIYQVIKSEIARGNPLFVHLKEKNTLEDVCRTEVDPKKRGEGQREHTIGFTLYSDSFETYPFHALEKAIDRYGKIIGKDWQKTPDNSGLVRTFQKDDPDYSRVLDFMTELVGYSPIVDKDKKGNSKVTFYTFDLERIGSEIGRNFLGGKDPTS